MWTCLITLVSGLKILKMRSLCCLFIFALVFNLGIIICVCVCVALASIFIFLGYFDQFDFILLSFEIGCHIT